MWPLQFFSHDLGHLNQQSFSKDYYSNYLSESKLISSKEKFFQMRDVLQSLSNQDPKNIALIKLLDFVFFSLHHEFLSGFLTLQKAVTLKEEPLTVMAKILHFFQFEYEPSISFPTDHKKERLLRNDWFAKALPDPKELGLPSHEKMYAFGKRLLMLLLSPKISPSTTTLEGDIDKLLHEYSYSTKKGQLRLAKRRISVSSSQFFPETGKFVLDKSQLDLYNKIVQSINDRHISHEEKLWTEIKKNDDELKRSIEYQTIDKVVEYFNNYDNKLSSLRVERIMDFIDRYYLEGL